MATHFYRFAVALGIGILVGMQRESVYNDHDARLFAGVRTFGLISLVGYGAALTSEYLQSALPFLAVVLVFGVLLALSYQADVVEGKLGMTTEMAAMIILVTGAMCYWGEMVLAAALAVSVTGMLSLKPQLRAFAHSITREDVYATLKFAVISIIVLPVLPNQAFGPPPFNVLNPYKIWLMVVFISGISFLGYVLIKIAGPRRGIGLTGLLGGIASSTAVTLSFAARSRDVPKLARPFALAMIVAWTVMFMRVLAVIFALERALAMRLAPPLLASLLVGLLYSAYLYFSQRTVEKEDVRFVNPFELGPAIKFGVVYTGILLVTKVAQVYFGEAGIYISSFVSGLADVDAIALSMVELVQSNAVSLDVATRATVIAAVANTLFKGIFAISTGDPALRKVLWPGLFLIVAVGLAMTFMV